MSTMPCGLCGLFPIVPVQLYLDVVGNWLVIIIIFTAALPTDLRNEC